MKQIFIWKRLGRVSDNYHSGGGLAIIADNYDIALGLADLYEDLMIDKEPDIALKIQSDVEDQVIIFPDAGCC